MKLLSLLNGILVFDGVLNVGGGLFVLFNLPVSSDFDKQLIGNTITLAIHLIIVGILVFATVIIDDLESKLKLMIGFIMGCLVYLLVMGTSLIYYVELRSDVGILVSLISTTIIFICYTILSCFLKSKIN